MNKFTISVLATVMLGTSFSTFAERMNDMDMSRMPTSVPAAAADAGGQTMVGGRMHDMDMSKMPTNKGAVVNDNQTMTGGRMHDMDMSKMNMKSPKAAHGVGVIKSIDTQTNMIVLNHQAIKELNWPPMSMDFKVADPKLLKDLKVGQKVTFELKSKGGKEIVTGIMPTK